MKRVRAILKDLQDSGQRVSIVGHFAIQPCHFQGVTNVNDVRDQPKNIPLSTDENQIPNRYTTEQGQSNERRDNIGSATVTLPPDLVEVIGVWADLPDSIKTGITAMVKTISK